MSEAVAGQADLPQALAAYEAERRPVVESTQRAAQTSLRWFEETERYFARLEPLQLAASLLTAAASDGLPPFELPFIVQGPWSDPVILPDAQILIRRSGAAAPLVNAIRDRLLRRERPQIDAPVFAPPPAPGGPAQPTLSGASDPVQ